MGKKTNTIVNFEEALKIIATTKKSAIDKQQKSMELRIDNLYNENIEEPRKAPQPTKSRL